MKIEVILENLDLFSSEPDRVSTLRDLIIELSVKGELVVGDSSDTPADVLLASTALERIKLEKLKAIRARKTLPGEYSDPPYQIPKSWAWARLSDVGYELGQKTPENTFTYIDVGSIDPILGRISDRVEQLEANQAPSRARKVVAEGTVIYSTVRPYLRNIAIVEKAFEPEPIASTAFGILHPFSGINNRYLFYWLRSKQFNSYVEKCMKGVAYPAINDEKFYGGYIPVPPTKEQDRIVAKVDELMALCNRLEAQLKERDIKQAALAKAALAKFTEDPTPENLQLLFHPSFSIEPKQLRKAVLSLAMQGKIAPQNNDEEPASQLIHRTVSALPNVRSKNPFLQKIAPLVTDESLYPLPNGWAWLPLGHIGTWSTGCGFPNKYQGKPSGEFLFCKVSDMNLSGNEVAIHTTVHQIDADVMEALRARPNPPGTIIFPKIGGAIATHKRRLVIKPTIIDNNCSGMQPIGLTDSSWLMLLLRNLDMTKYQSGTSVPAVSQGSLDPIRIGLPPLAEQIRIVEKMRQLEGMIDALEAQLEASRTTGERLLEAMVAELTSA